MNSNAVLTQRALSGAGSEASAFSYGLLNIAHALQDAQYGLGAVLNNIPLVAQVRGGPDWPVS